ncbi:MAG TPA: hypothetical protein VGD99_03815 [Anaerolineae bacterium]
MKKFHAFLLIIIGLLVACSSSELPGRVAAEAGLSLSPTTRSTPTPFASVTIDIATLPPLASPTKPIATPSGEAIAVESEPEVDGRRAVFPNTIIVYQKEGQAGQEQWTIYHTGRVVTGSGTEWQVQSGQVKPLFDLVESPDFWELDNEYAPDVECIDCLKQIVTVYYEGKIKEITVIDPSVEIPQHLRNVLDALERLAS